MPLSILAPFTALLLILSVLPAYTSAAPPLAQGTTEDGQEEEDQAQDPNAQDQQGQNGEGEGEGDPNTDTQTQNQQLQGAGTATIVINKFECLADYLGDKSKFISYCLPPSSQIEFQVYGPNFTRIYQSGFTQADLEPGVFQIREILPQGWYPIVFCQKSTQVLNDGGNQQVVIYDGYYEVEVLGGEYLYCDWFNIPPLRADLIINKHYCPQEFDAYTADLNDLARECQEDGPDVDFTISQNGAEAGTETATGTPQSAIFSQIQPGQTTIVETVPDGYGAPIVYCGVDDTLGNDIGGDMAPVDNDRWTWQVGSGHVVFCDVFNVYAERYGTISVLKITCPEDFTPSNGGTFEYYEEECTEPTEGVSFKLDGASTGNPGSQETDQNGQVTWNEREADTYYISEEPPEETPWPYGPPVIYCSYYDPAALADREWEAYDLDNEGRIMFELGEGENFSCVWFNLYDEYGSVTVYKYTCPEDIGYGTGSYDYYRSECEPWTEGISFTLEGDSTGNPESQETDDDGKTVWNEREEDIYYLTEEAPDGEDWPYGRPMVYCYYYVPGAGPPTWDQYETDDQGRIQFELDHQQDIVCYWFNVYDDEYGSVTVYKYTCPDHIGYGAGSYGYYASECDDWTEGVSFKLDGASTGNPGSQETDANGVAYWDEREEDTYYLNEEEPEDGPWPYGQPAVFCYYYVPGSGQPGWEQYETDDEGRIEFELGYRQDIVCIWFNLYEDAPPASPSPSASPTSSPSPSPSPSSSPRPIGPGGYIPPTGGQGSPPTGPATLILNKYDCEPGYDWIADDSDPADDCTEQPDGVVYELELYDGPPNQQPRRAETGEDNPGEARFTGVRAGDYVLTELDVEEGTFAFILSCDSTRRDFDDYPYYPFAVASSEGVVYLTIVAGETLECDWYNVAPDPDGDEDQNGQGGRNNRNDEDEDQQYGLLLEVYSCDGQERSIDACDPQGDPISYALIPVDGGDPVTLETEDGSGGLDGLDGTYTLVQVGLQPCVVESSDVDAQGNLSLSANKSTLVRVFNCA